MPHEAKDAVAASEHTLGEALGAVAGTALDQAHVLAIAQVDRWAEFLRQRLAAPVEEPSAEPAPSAAPAPAPAPSALKLPDFAKPLLVGALAGAAVAWLFARRRTDA